MTRLNIPLFVALAASILSAIPVDGRDTLPHQRMIRKRGPSAIGDHEPIGAAAVIGLRIRQEADPTGSASQPASSAPASTSAAASSSAAPSSASAAPSSTSAAPTSSAAAATTSSTSSSSSPAQETPTLNLATTPAATARSQSVSVVAYTSTLAPEVSASISAAAAEKTKKITRNTIVSLVVVASCIGGAIGIWTVIRKWKLSPSEKFDDRMQPIDWAPPPNGVTEDAIEEKSKHRRAGSGASHGSFTSGGVGQSEQGHGAKYADSQHGHAYGAQPQDFPPPHDFTAGATQPGGYGQYYGGQQYAAGPGYADLQRGPSVSESTYSHGASVSRGLSYSRGHGAYDSQSGPVPPMPNPYGGEYGYEDYNHPPAGQQPPAQGQAPYRAF
ncbi:unnamed protein product [Rhizoctonia solani]|uniref:Mid2 domain-containing protein n=1 Tax=Rhizoctonia solani TaxID=456999 RepID=A0A8H3HI65_9AGAM|nr:unnamed protein product [Rhizoctonia solani]CAE6511453.1 unnamed protein product [Rhizoctonia solani]